MGKALGAVPPELPAGSRARAMTQEEFRVWQEDQKEGYAQSWVSRGVPDAEARAKAERDHATLLPDGLATEGMIVRALEHDGIRIGAVWLGARHDQAFVYDVETDEAHRGRGHGRTLMLLAEAEALHAGWTDIGLNVFAGNTPAERLYASLGYETITYHLYKDLL
jgi:ribosomal protein S18 acetylase RimI-like enzyme